MAKLRRRALRRLQVGNDSNYGQRRGREVLHREANNELQYSDKMNFMKWLVLKASEGHL